MPQHIHPKGNLLTTATLEPQQTETHIPSSIPSNIPAVNTTATGLPGVANVHFNDFNISDSLKNRLGNAGFTTPTPVQARAIPPALEFKDILATASTGTGKTLSFLIPMIERMDANSVPSTKGKRGPVRALILLPTR